MASNNLIPTPITDKNGKATIVYRSPEEAPRSTGKGLPAPTMQAYVPPKEKKASAPQESYEERRERIRGANARWAKGERPTSEELAPIAMESMDSMSNIMMTIASEEDYSDREDLATSAGVLAQNKDFAAVIACDRFREVHYTLSDIENMNESDPDDPFEVSFDGEDTSDWSSEYATSRNSTEVIDLIMTLRENDLMDRTEVPEHGDSRFFAHLYLSATKTLNYRMDDDNTIAVIKLVDRYPERTEEIAEALRKNLHAEGIRALLEGDLHSGIVSGAL